MKDGSTLSEEINVADAHPAGKRPFTRKEYINKFKTLTDVIISKKESDRFLNTVQDLKNLRSNELLNLNIDTIPSKKTKKSKKLGIF